MINRVQSQTNLTFFETNVLRFYLLMLFGCLYVAFSSVDQGAIAEKAGDSPFYQLLWIALYISVLCLLFRDLPALTRTLTVRFLPAFLILTTGVAYLLFPPSSAAPAIKFAMYMMTILFGLWISIRMTPRQFFDQVYLLAPIVMLVHWMAFPFVHDAIAYDAGARLSVVGLPAYGGIFGHKNLAGVFFGFCVLTTSAKILTSGKVRASSLLLLGGFFLSLMMTGAAGPLLSTVGGGMLLLGCYFSSRGHPSSVAYWLVLAVVAALVCSVGLAETMAAVGRDSTFSGRTFLIDSWSIFYFRQPIFGYGYAGFFTYDAASPAWELSSMDQWMTIFYTFESSYLELLIEFGAVGGAIFAAVILVAFRNAYAYAASNSGASDALLPLAALIAVLLYSISDTYLVLHNHFFSVIVFWCYFGLKRNRSEIIRGLPSKTARRKQGLRRMQAI